MRARPRHSTVVAYLALFVALGGTSYAAVTLAKNSVKSKHIAKGAVKASDLKKNAVRTDKVKDGSLLAADFKAGELVAGAPGPQGPQGPAGPRGEAGRDLTHESTLPSGKTLTGVFSAASADSGEYSTTALEFRPQLSGPIADANIHYMPPATPATTECPGRDRAAPGHLCIYPVSDPIVYIAPYRPSSNAEQGADKNGTVLYWSGNGTDYVRGTWAVTAP